MKKNNKKGFTLAELLIVIAIIAVLVAIAIPVFSTALDDAREAVEDANMRAARAEAAVEYVVNGRTGEQAYSFDVSESGVITVNNTSDATEESCVYDEASRTYSGVVIVDGTQYE